MRASVGAGPAPWGLRSNTKTFSDTGDYDERVIAVVAPFTLASYPAASLLEIPWKPAEFIAPATTSTTEVVLRREKTINPVGEDAVAFAIWSVPVNAFRPDPIITPGSTVLAAVA